MVQHDETVVKVLKALQRHNITLNKEKCRFGVAETIFLRFKVSSKGIEPDPENLKSVVNYPTPRNAADVRQVYPKYIRYDKPFTFVAENQHNFCVE